MKFFVIDGNGDFVYNAECHEDDFKNIPFEYLVLIGDVLFWHGYIKPKLHALEPWKVYLSKSKFYERCDWW